MFSIFLKRIPQIIYEPIAVGGALGLLVAAFFYCRFKKPVGKFAWLIACTVIFMLSWRLAIQIISSRYAEFLIYPACIATVFLCFKVPELLFPLVQKYIPQKFWKIWKLLPYMLVCGFCIASVCKAVRYNPHMPIISMAQVVKEDAAKHPGKRVFILGDHRCRQYSYYSGLKGKRYRGMDFKNHEPNIWTILYLIRRHRVDNDLLYFFIVEKTENPPFELIVRGKKNPNWRFISQDYMNRREDKVLRVYCYMVP